MAEFALGLTKTAVEGTLSRVKSVIEEEGKQRERVQEDLVFITGEFQMMQAFLNASSAKEHASRNPVARAWVRQLRDLAFDVENCVEFVVHLDKPSPLDWVQRLAASLPCLARPLLPLDVAVADIKRLRARVEDVSQRNTRYNLMAGGGDNDGENRHQQLLMPPAVAGGHISAPGAETFPILRDAWMAMGKLCHTTGDLRKLIDCQGSELRVISLWGSAHADFPGELGWASIVKTAYEDPQICKQFKSRAWIKLTNPFNPAEFLNNLLAHFTSHRHDRHDDMSKLMLQVSQHKYLIILDQELSSVADWEAIKKCLPDGNTGSRIIVSTKLLGIARGCTGEPFQVWELQRFSHDRYLCAIFAEGCGHRIGVAEFIWQLKRRPGVMSLCFDTYGDMNLLASELFAQDGDTQRLRVVDEVKFEHQYVHTSKSQDGKFNVERYEDDKFDLADLADSILKEYSREDEIADSEWDEFKGMSRRGKIETCRKFLTEHEWLVYIDEGVQSPADWDLIKEELLCESTSSCIVVITDNPSVAKHCVGHQQHLALNVEDLLNKQGSDERCQSRHAGGEGNIIIKEEGESESESESESDSDSEAESEPEPDRLPGRKEEADFIRWPMISASSIECVTLLSVWGIAGVGKSAVVRQVYDDRDELEHKRYGWVDAPHPFSLTVLCQRLLLNFYLDDPHAKEAAAIGMVEGHDPVQMCCKILRQKRCFLVIDDLRSTHDWDLIQAALFPDPNIGGATVVITREESIARHCAHREEDILNVKGLQPDVALDLFKKISLDGKKSSEIPPDAEKISKLVTSKCGGIPEVIVAVGKLARAYQGEIRTLENINVEFMRELDTPQSSSSLRGLFCWMQSYFDECSDELKPCIFYMSIFPAEESVRRRRLLRRWIAEGYSSRGDGTAEEKAEKLLSKLMKLSIFYKSQKSCTTTSCKVNGFFHEYIKSRPMEDNLVFELTGSCGPRSGLTGQHLTISSSWDRDETVFKSIDLSRLRSLTVFGKWVPFLINSDNLKMLRALDLEDTSSTPESDGTGVVTDADLEIIGKLLTRLKFLSLRRCKKVTRLPDSFGGMRQLETLDVRHTHIVELPPCVITKLHKLQYIRAGNTETIRPQEAAVAAPMPTPTETPPAPITTTTQEDVHSGTSPFLQATAAAPVLAGGISGAWKSRAHALVESSSGSSWWESKKQRRRRVRVAANGGGVEVACAATEGIGKLTELHTLGVVNIAGAKFGLLLLKELKQLTQLRKLGLSGINRGNWSALCLAVSGYLPHLESLSLQLLLLEGEPSYEFACFDNISEPPKTLKSLKVLYTSALCAGACGAYIKPAWISKLPNLIKFDHGSTVSSQEDIDFLLSNGFPSGLLEKRLHVKTVRQHLSFDRPQSQVVSLGVLMIDCSSSSSLVTFGKSYTFSVPVIRIRCCSTCGGMSCLRIVGLQHVHRLEHVLVTGPCSGSFEEDLRKQLGENLCYPKPEMKLLG